MYLSCIMSCNYADGLSPYENKGILGLPENFETAEKLKEKCDLLAGMIAEAKHVVIHTGAGISTSAGIPDFRGPNGVWTLERDGRKPNINISFAEAKPTKTHMALKELVETKKVHYIISQNIDGLHLKSGLSRDYLAELHGNMFVDQCNTCHRQFARSSPVSTVGQRTVGEVCKAGRISGRPCRGRLHDVVLDWEHNLPENDLLMADMHSCMADLSICLGTTLQIVPSGNLPLNTLKYGGKLVICNLQPTKHDNKTDLVINYYVDEILSLVMKTLNLEIPEYAENDDPTSNLNQNKLLEWTIHKDTIKETQVIYKTKCRGVPKTRQLVKRKRKRNGQRNGLKACIKTEKNEIKLKKNEIETEKNEIKTEKNEIKTEKNEIKLEEISYCKKNEKDEVT